MKQSVPANGAESVTYAKSLIYFNWREKKGLKLPTAASANKKQKKNSKKAMHQTSNTEEAGDKSKPTTKKEGSDAFTAADLADITLPKEDTRRRHRSLRQLRRDPREDQRTSARARRHASAVMPRPCDHVPHAQEAQKHLIAAAHGVSGQKGSRCRQHERRLLRRVRLL